MNLINPFLIGQSIYLSPLTKEDITMEYVNWLNDQEICKYNSHATFPNNLKKTTEYVSGIEDSNTNFVFAIRWKENNKHIGNVALQSINWINRSGELAILVGDKYYWGKGVGTECYKLLIEYSFNTLNLIRVFSGQVTENSGMIKVCQKVGMQKEGCLKKALFKGGEYKDIEVYAIINV